MHPFVSGLKNLIFLPEGVDHRSPFLEVEGTKLIFDHIRNFTIAALIAQVGLYSLTLQGGDGPFSIARGFGWLFISIAVGLFILNFFHGEYLLSHSPHFHLIRFKRIIHGLYWTIYFASALLACFFNVMRAL